MFLPDLFNNAVSAAEVR